MKLKLSILIMLNIIITSCSYTSIFRMKGPDDFLNKYAASTLGNKKINTQEKKDQVISDLERWRKDKWQLKYYNCPGYKRWRSLYNPNTNITDENTFKINVCNFNNTLDVYNNNDNLIYIGKWYYLKKLNKNIRFIVFYDEKNYKGINAYFEVMNKYNKDIPYTPLVEEKIRNNTKIQQHIRYYELDKLISTIKWLDKYGYNTYIDLRTGEIKQAKE